MEQATLSRPAARERDAVPPGSGLPAVLQALRYARDPLGFLVRLRERYGDVFAVRFPYFERLVYLADPALVKELFTGPPRQFHAGEAVTSRTFARLVSSYADWIVTIDPHLHRYDTLNDIYGVPTRVVHAAPAVAEWIAAHVDRPVLVGPDAESDQWVSDVARRVGAPSVVTVAESECSPPPGTCTSTW